MYAELKRVQQYFAKIKAAEEPEAQRKLVVNKEAAARVLRAGLVVCPQGLALNQKADKFPREMMKQSAGSWPRR